MEKRSIVRFLAVILWVSVLSSVLAAQALQVSIDIKPGDTPTTIEPNSQGMLPVAILTTPQFDAASADPSSVTIGPTGTEAGVFRSMLEDVDEDGDTDRMLLFRVQEMGVKCSDSVILLKGKTTDGRAIEGSESVQTDCDTTDRK